MALSQMPPVTNQGIYGTVDVTRGETIRRVNWNDHKSIVVNYKMIVINNGQPSGAYKK